MKINWKVRFQNKAFLASLLALTITFVYDLLAMLGITPAMDENALLSIADTVLKVLCLMGVIIDPTTQGVNDSERAMSYDEPA